MEHLQYVKVYRCFVLNQDFTGFYTFKDKCKVYRFFLNALNNLFLSSQTARLCKWVYDIIIYIHMAGGRNGL